MNSIAKEAADFGLKPLKKLGQNFIFDSTLCDKIVRESGVNPGGHIVEVGPGPAGLTRSILNILKPRKLTIIETDTRCLPLLESIQLKHPALDIIHADALKVRIPSLIEGGQKVDIIANLPYNIGTKLLIDWLTIDRLAVNSLTLMLQREVVLRLSADVGTKEYGRLSVLVQNLATARKLFDVSPQAFYPAPKVWSSIVSIKPNYTPVKLELIKAMSEISAIFFSNRRKKIRASVKKIYPEDPDSLANKIGFNLDDRPENMPPDKYLQVAQHLLKKERN